MRKGRAVAVLKLKHIPLGWTVIIQMNLEDIMLSEISQSQKDNYCVILPL